MWTSHLSDPEAKRKFAEALGVQINSAVFDRFVEILLDKERAAMKETFSYDTASWAYYQAHNNGYRMAMMEIRDLFNIPSADSLPDKRRKKKIT